MSLVLALLRKFTRLRPPPRLTARVYIWAARAFVIEFAWILALGTAGLLAVLLFLGDAGSTLGILALAVLGLWELWLLYLTWVSLRSAAAVRSVLDDLDEAGEIETPEFPTSQILFPPLLLFARGVRHERAVEYANVDGRPLLLDVYLPKETDRDDDRRPAVIQVHGGGWIAGSRMEQGIPLLNHLATDGWVGFNIDYRLSPRATFPDHLVDVKRAIAWVRENAERHGADPDFICLTGGSAGGHLTALAALTADDRSLQPGFEDADTSVAAAVPFYAVYDFTDRAGEYYYPELRDWVMEEVVIKKSFAEHPEAFEAASPICRIHADAPPFLVIHGDRDSLVPVEDAREFVAALREVSREPVIYAELRGAEHAFDIVPSVRTARIVETIERFLFAVRERRAAKLEKVAA